MGICPQPNGEARYPRAVAENIHSILSAEKFIVAMRKIPMRMIIVCPSHSKSFVMEELTLSLNLFGHAQTIRVGNSKAGEHHFRVMGEDFFTFIDYRQDVWSGMFLSKEQVDAISILIVQEGWLEA